MNKSIINRLSDDIINKLRSIIIINDPSCVLKELMENSIDASSSSISVHMYNYGFDLIKVIDNGIGIYECDLHKICSHFNTSKISKLDDLNNIKTYGFRGESLSAIRSVSRLKIISKPVDQVDAYAAIFNGEYDVNVSLSHGITGTVVEVKNLFYNNMDYKNFFSDLKNEFYKNYIIFKSIALSRFDVRFLFFNNGKEIVNLPVCGDSYSKNKRIEALNNSFHFDDVIDVNLNDLGISFHGFIYLNFSKRGVKYDKFFYINNRLVNSIIIDSIFSDILGVNNKNLISFGYYLYLYLDVSFYSIILSIRKTDVVFKDYSFMYNFLFKILSEELNNKFYLAEESFFIKKTDESRKHYESDDFFCVNTSLKHIVKFENSILTVLNNFNVFFRLNDKVYVVRLDVVRARLIYNLCFYQHSKIGRIFRKKNVLNKLLDLHIFSTFWDFKDFLFCYGIEINLFNDTFLIVTSVPVLLYNLSVNWMALFFDLKNFLERYVLSNFSRNRFDASIVNIFINHISKNSLYKSYETNLFYKELFNSSLHDVEWFNKNCFEIVIK